MKDTSRRSDVSLPLALARSIIAHARSVAEAERMLPLAIVVLDPGGHVVACERDDGASNMRFKVAHGKAFGAIGLGVGSRALMERAEAQPYFITSVGNAIGGALVPVPGGVLVKDRSTGAIIGAVGISGESSDNDELVAIAGIGSSGYEAVPA